VSGRVRCAYPANPYSDPCRSPHRRGATAPTRRRLPAQVVLRLDIFASVVRPVVG